MSKTRSKRKQKQQERARKRFTVLAGRGMPANANTATPEPVDSHDEAYRPTPERKRHGKWAEPQGQGKAFQPVVDLAPDMIGRLYQTNRINTSQEQAARLFQELRADYVAELGTVGYKSCLSGGVQGWDESDGDPEVIARYRSLERRIGRVKTAVLLMECDKGPSDKPGDLDVLRTALNCVAGV